MGHRLSDVGSGRGRRHLTLCDHGVRTRTGGRRFERGCAGPQERQRLSGGRPFDPKGVVHGGRPISGATEGARRAGRRRRAGRAADRAGDDGNATHGTGGAIERGGRDRSVSDRRASDGPGPDGASDGLRPSGRVREEFDDGRASAPGSEAQRCGPARGGSRVRTKAGPAPWTGSTGSGTGVVRSERWPTSGRTVTDGLEGARPDASGAGAAAAVTERVGTLEPGGAERATNGEADAAEGAVGLVPGPSGATVRPGAADVDPSSARATFTTGSDGSRPTVGATCRVIPRLRALQRPRRPLRTAGPDHRRGPAPSSPLTVRSLRVGRGWPLHPEPRRGSSKHSIAGRARCGGSRCQARSSHARRDAEGRRLRWRGRRRRT